MKQIVFVLMVLFTSCIVSEDAPVKFVDGTPPKPPVVFTVPCSYSNSITMDGILTSGNIINIAGQNMPDYTISGETINGTYGEFEMILDNGRPKSNILYTYTDGVCSPSNMTWYWGISGKSYYPRSGNLYVEVLANGDVKFTWCSLYFKTSSSSTLRLSRGSFLLD